MVKQLIGALIGGLILFFWQFASWSALNIHGSQNSYTANQSQILEYLSGNLPQGEYFLPTVAPGASPEEMAKLQEDVMGKPWARVQMYESFEMNMGMNMLRGFIVNFVSVFLLCWILMKIPQRDFMTVFLSSLAVGVIGYMTLPYLESIWFQGDTIPELIDTFVQWGICGAFLGWWLNR